MAYSNINKVIVFPSYDQSKKHYCINGVTLNFFGGIKWEQELDRWGEGAYFYPITDLVSVVQPSYKSRTFTVFADDDGYEGAKLIKNFNVSWSVFEEEVDFIELYARPRYDASRLDNGSVTYDLDGTATYNFGDKAAFVIDGTKPNYIDYAKDNYFAYNTVHQNVVVDYEIISLSYRYREEGGTWIEGGSFSTTAFTIPANTLASGKKYEFEISATSDDGETTTLSFFTSTEDSIGICTAFSPDNGILYGDAEFVWSYSNEKGNDAIAFDIQAKVDDGPYVLIANHINSSLTTYETYVELNGKITWAVRSYNRDNIPSEWSNELTFINKVPPTPPTIKSIEGNSKVRVIWETNGQIAYRVKIGNLDSGVIYSTNNYHYFDDYLIKGNYVVEVKIYNNLGDDSNWATKQFTVNKVFNDPVFNVEQQEGFNRITFTPENGYTYELFRDGLSLGIVDGMYDDYFVNGESTYRLIKINNDGFISYTDLVFNYKCNVSCVIDRNNEIIYINQRNSQIPSYSSRKEIAANFVNYLGRKKQVFKKGTIEAQTWNIVTGMPLELGKLYFFRTYKGYKCWCVCTSLNNQLNYRGPNEYSYQLVEVDDNEL